MGAITESEHRRLQTLEKVIRNGMDTFVRVGQALFEIKKDKLYRSEFSTWDAYCKERWGFTQQHAGRLITASETAQRIIESEPRGSLLKPLPTEKHARALAQAPPEEQAEIWEDVLDDNEDPTAKDVREKVEERRKPKAAPVLQQKVDPVVERAKASVPDLCRKLGFQLGNLGAQGRFDAYLSEMEEFAR